MKQAILITAHGKLENLLDIIDYFDSNFNLYIHVDKRCSIIPKTVIRIEKNSKVKFFSQKYKTNWSSFTYLKSILLLSKEALKDKDNSYFHLISGQDFPTKDIPYFLSFENNNIDSYLNNFELPNKQWQGNGGLDRVNLFNFNDYLDERKNYRFFLILRKLQKILRVNRGLNTKFKKIYGGSSWWSLSRQVLSYVIEFTHKNNQILKLFRFTFCPEELFFQTVIMNSNYSKSIINNNLRYIDWNSRNGSNPSFLDMEDLKKLEVSDSLFARKFHPIISSELKSKLITNENIDLNQLISIVIITYNSSEFILETLESIKNQDYNNLELIISDDCSTDKTLDIVEKWTITNKYRFKKILILKSKTNKGTSINITKGCKEAKGKWIKPMPGDDILLPNAISEYVDFAEENNSRIVYSSVKKLIGSNISELSYPINNILLNKSSKEQYNNLINGAPFYSPTEFYSKIFLEKMNYFDTKYKLIEDFPFLLKATKSGVKIDFIKKDLMLYRVSMNSTSNSSLRKSNFINKIYFDDLNLIYQDFLAPNLNIYNFIGIIDQKIKLLRMKKTLENKNTKKDFENTRWLNLFNPKYLLLKLKLIKEAE